MSSSDPPDLEQEDYGTQDSYLQHISKNFVSIKPEDKNHYNHHLKVVVDNLIERMKKKSPVFSDFFSKEKVAGSYWDKLKVGKPEEFDKNFVVRMPKIINKYIEIKPALPSFVFVNVGQGLKELKKNNKRWEMFKKMEAWVDRDGMLLTNEVRSWMESVIDKALKELDKDGDRFLLVTDKSTYKLKTVKAGPAITVQVEIYGSQNTKFHIDIVPAFEFSEAKWPSHIVPCPSESRSKNWHLVPKPIRPGDAGQSPQNTLWRLSFHDQESHILQDTYHLKAALKLLKKLRDVKEQKLLSSYAIKTIFLLERKKQKTRRFWQQGLSKTFIYMLRVLTEHLAKGEIPFYWDSSHNLLWQLTDPQKFQLYSTFHKIYKNIISSLTTNRLGNLVIAREILTPEEFTKIPDHLIIDERSETKKRKRKS